MKFKLVLILLTLVVGNILQAAVNYTDSESFEDGNAWARKAGSFFAIGEFWSNANSLQVLVRM